MLRDIAAAPGWVYIEGGIILGWCVMVPMANMDVGPTPVVPSSVLTGLGSAGGCVVALMGLGMSGVFFVLCSTTVNAASRSH